MANTVIMLIALVGATSLVAYLSFIGRLTSRAMVILMPAATLMICVVTLMVAAGDSFPSLLFVGVGVMTVTAFVLILATLFLLIASPVGGDPIWRIPGRQDSTHGKTEE